MKKSLWILCVIVFLSTLVFGQEKAAPVPVQFKFTPGRTMNYKLTMVGDGELKLSSKNTTLNSFGFNSAIPVDLSMNMFLPCSTLSVTSEGNGVIQYRIDSMDINVGIMGMKINMDMENGKMVMKMNGQPMPDFSNNSTLNKMPKLTDMVFEITVSPQGKVLDYKAPKMEGMPSFPGMDMNNFSFWKDKVHDFFVKPAFQVGDYWATTTKFEFPGGVIKLNRPLEIVAEYYVKGFSTYKDQNVMTLKQTSNQDFSGMSLSFSTSMMSALPMGGAGLSNLSLNCRYGSINQSGDIIISTVDGTILNITQEMFLKGEIAIKIPLGMGSSTENQSLDFNIGGKGKFLVKMELQ